MESLGLKSRLERKLKIMDFAPDIVAAIIYMISDIGRGRNPYLFNVVIIESDSGQEHVELVRNLESLEILGDKIMVIGDRSKLKPVEDSLTIDEEISLFIKDRSFVVINFNNRLIEKCQNFINDDDDYMGTPTGICLTSHQLFIELSMYYLARLKCAPLFRGLLMVGKESGDKIQFLSPI